MCWTLKSKELYLHPSKEWLISLRIPFMQVRELPRGRQYSVNGNVVNVPVDSQPVVNVLPRPFDENEIIQQIMRIYRKCTTLIWLPYTGSREIVSCIKLLKLQ